MPNRMQLPAATDEATRTAFNKLSSREVDTFLALAVGFTNEEIGGRLGVSVKTIDTHRGNTLKKLSNLGVRGNVDIARLALRLSLVTLDDSRSTFTGIVTS